MSTSTETETQVRTLLDRTAIIEQIHAYCDHVDRVDLDSLVDLFTEDAVFDYGNGSTFQGREALKALFTDRLGIYRATNHHCSTERVLSCDGSTAESIAYVYAFHETAATDKHVHVWGRYEDSWQNQDGTWRIRERRVRVAGVETTDADALPDRFERYQRATLPQA